MIGRHAKRISCTVAIGLVAATLSGCNEDGSAPRAVSVAISGTMGLDWDYCTFRDGTSDDCWIQEGRFELTNNSSETFTDLALQVDYYDCTGVATDAEDASTCRAAARTFFACTSLYLRPHTKVGCSQKLISRGRLPFDREDYIWFVQAVR